MLSDNGAVFTGRCRGAGRVVLEVTLNARGISFRHSPPYHPQTCGKVERFHQTLTKWLATQPRAGTLQQLQSQLDAFRAYYNTVRPHRALNRRTPNRPTTPGPKRSRLAPRSTTVTTGSATTPSTPAAYSRCATTAAYTHRHQPPARRHAGTDIFVLIHDLHVRVLTTDGELLRELHLDPTKDYQRQPKP
jgi:hypothetical protein